TQNHPPELLLYPEIQGEINYMKKHIIELIAIVLLCAPCALTSPALALAPLSVSPRKALESSSLAAANPSSKGCAQNWLTAARSVGFRRPRCSWRSCSLRD